MMNIKAVAGTAVGFFVAVYVLNTYLYLPFAASAAAGPAPAAMLPLWASLAVVAVIESLFLDWANGSIKNPVRTALILAIAQILLVDVYYVLNGQRGLTQACASAATLLVSWLVGGFVYKALSAARSA